MLPLRTKAVVTFEEGMRNVPYLCSMGFVTVGIGTKLCNIPNLDPKDFPIKVSRRQAEEWLATELLEKEQRLLNSVEGGTYTKQNADTKAILLSMAYQLGVSGLLGFKKMWINLDAGYKQSAAKEAMDSKWAVQTPGRAKRHAKVISGLRIVEVYDV